MHPLALLFVALTVALLAGVPISYALVLSSLLVIWAADLPATVAIQQMFKASTASPCSRCRSSSWPAT